MDYRLGSLVAYRDRTWVLASRKGNLLSPRSHLPLPRAPGLFPEGGL